MDVSVASEVETWWQCPVGHEWRESVRSRTAPREWKHGDLAACPLCLGARRQAVYDCGHPTTVRTGHLDPTYECPTCVHHKLRASKQRWDLLLQARTDYEPTRPEIDTRLDALDFPRSMPAALAVEWRRHARRRIGYAMIQEFGYGDLGAAGAVDEALRTLNEKGDQQPDADRLRAALEAGEPIEIYERRFWTQGVVHVMDLPMARKISTRSVGDRMDQSIRAILSSRINRRRPRWLEGTAAMTSLITDLVVAWGEADEDGPWRGHRELTPPFIPSDGRMCGKVDIVLTRPETADIVVEIDSTHNLRSLEKLQFAASAGATAIWIRWHSGAPRSMSDIHVIDLIDLTRAES